MKENKNSNKEVQRPESLKTIFLFSVFGFLSYLAFGVIIASAQEILSAYDASTSTIWIGLSLPMTILPSIMAYIFDRLPPVAFVLGLFPLHAGALACLLLAGSHVWLSFVGICLAGSASVVADVTGMSLTAYFDGTTVTAYCCGTGISFICGPLYVTAMISWMNISNKVTLCVAFVAVPLFYLLSFLMLEDRRNKVRLVYQPVMTEENPKSHLPKADRSQSHKHLTSSEKFRVTVAVLPDLVQIFLGIIFHDFILSGVATTLVFTNSPFPPADHYKYYLIVSFCGLFLGRSYLGLVDFIRPGLSKKCRIRQTWLLVVIAAWHVFIFIYASLNRFLPNVWYVLILVFTLGVFAEATFANLSVKFSEMKDYRVKEFAMGLAIFGLQFGTLIGVTIAAPTERLLLRHCLLYTNETTTCITRNMNLTHALL